MFAGITTSQLPCLDIKLGVIMISSSISNGTYLLSGCLLLTRKFSSPDKISSGSFFFFGQSSTSQKSSISDIFLLIPIISIQSRVKYAINSSYQVSLYGRPSTLIFTSVKRNINSKFSCLFTNCVMSVGSKQPFFNKFGLKMNSSKVLVS